MAHPESSTLVTSRLGRTVDRPNSLLDQVAVPLWDISLRAVKAYVSEMVGEHCSNHHVLTGVTNDVLKLQSCDSTVTVILSQSFTLSSLFLCTLNVGCSQGVVLSLSLCQDSHIHSHIQT